MAALAVAGVMAAVVAGAGRDATAEPGSARVIPDPTDTTSVVTVKVGGDRADATTVDPLEGVTLGLFADADAEDPLNDTWALCTSDADGDCNFIVPDTQQGGGNRNIRPYVREISSATGWFSNFTLRTGDGDGSDSEATVYQFRTPGLQGGLTYSSTSDFMIDSSEQRDASGGVWQDSRTNPTIDSACGLDVALLLDLSGSVEDSLPQLKQAADTFVDALVGTPSQVALFSFSTGSPANGADQDYPDLMPVSTQGDADGVKALYTDWEAGGGTNWDQGLFQLAQLGPDYPLAIIITDGNPTYFGDPVQGNGSDTRFREVENGIFSANSIKSEGTRVLAFGVGSGVSSPETGLNLGAISGPEGFDGTNASTADYFQTDDYAAAGAALRALALGRCLGSLSVVKEIVPMDNEGEDVTGAVPAGPGWTMSGSTATPDIGGLPDDETTDDSGTGTVSFDLTYPGDTPSASVKVNETQHDAFTLVTQGGQNAVCEDLGSGLPLAVVDDDSDPTHPGFTVDVPRLAAVSCTVYNRPDKVPPTTTSTSTTSTSTTSTSTTSTSTSTTSTSTTSTTMPTTSSSILPSSTTPSTTPPTTTPPTTKPAPRHLPKTGSDTGWLLMTGGALLALGASLVAWAHRRRFG